MKKLIVLLLLVPSLVFGATISWTQPVTYANGSAVTAAKMATVKTHLYADGVEFALTTGGATSWAGTLPQTVGTSKTYTAKAELDNVISAASPPTVFLWILPLVNPGAITIQLGPTGN